MPFQRRIQPGSASRPPRRLSLTVVVAVVVLALSAAAAACDDGDGSDAQTDRVVARVDGREVRQGAVAAVLAEARLVGQKEDAAAALDQAIERELLSREAERLGVTVSTAAVDERAAAVTEQLGGADALAEALAGARMSASEYRRSLEAAVLLEALRAAKYADISSSASEAREYYERRRDDLFTRAAAVDLGAIFVRNEGIAGNAVKRLDAGRPFEEVARQFSIDPELKDSAGRMGWIDTRSLPGRLGERVAKLPVGEVSAPVAGSGGVWIFKVFRRRAAETVPFAEVREQLIDRLTGRERGRALKQWLADAVERADIERL